MDGGVPAEMRQLMTDLMRDASVQAMRQQRPGAIPADSAGQAPSYEDQLRRKRREKRQQLYQLHSGMSVAAAMDYGSGNTKPSRAACSAEAVDCTAVTRRRLPGLLPVQVNGLHVNTTHTGRVLRGTLVEQPCLMNSVQVLLKDEAGNIVFVAIYNWAGFDTRQNMMERWIVMDQHFSPGTHIAVIEPFFKVMADGTRGVRIDNPETDVVWLDRLVPLDAAGLKEQANQHFRQKDYAEAEACYNKALSATMVSSAGEEHLLLKLMLNAANCFLKLNQPNEASLWSAAAAAIVTDPPSALAAKAWYRLAEAMALSQEEGSLVAGAYREAARLNPALKPDVRTKVADRAGKALPAAPSGQILMQVFSASLPGNLGSGGSYADEGPVSLSAAEALGRDPAALKQKGNHLFTTGDTAGALQLYLAALRACCGPATSPAKDVIPLLSNRAQCHLAVGEYQAAVVDAGAVLLLDPSHAKSHYRRALALLNLDTLSLAEGACRSAQASMPADADMRPISQLGARVKAAMRQRAAASKSAAGKDVKQAAKGRDPEVRNVQEPGAYEDRSSLEAIAITNTLMATVEKLGGGLPQSLSFAALDKRVPELHNEFGREGRWPPQCDPGLGMRLLQNAYEHARSIGVSRLRLQQEHVTPSDIIKRLGVPERNKLEWWERAPPGSIYPQRHAGYGRALRLSGDGEIETEEAGNFIQKLCHSFGNTPLQPQVMHVGTTHVAVGFTDMSTLLHGSRVAGDSADGGGPLRWVGFEMSAYACAKTAVIACMLSQGAAVDEVLQVWFSAAWSIAARDAFREALTAVMSEEAGGNTTPEMAGILAYWQVHDVPLVESRRTVQQDLHDKGGTYYDIANWRQRADRLALCQYLLTRELLQPDVGSIVMFAVPPGTGMQRPKEEHFLHAIDERDLLRRRKTSADVVKAGISILQERISNLREAMAGGEVQVEVHHKEVFPESCGRDAKSREEARAVHRQIAGMQPFTMSWSNVFDYMTPSAFHAMARACSAPQNTVHTGYSMNWPQNVKGASVFDYIERQELVDKLWEEGKDLVVEICRMAQAEHLLLCPPVDNVINLGDYVCHGMFYTKWAKAFFGDAGMADPEKQVATVNLKPYAVWAQSNTTLYMTWTYDQAITFKARTP